MLKKRLFSFIALPVILTLVLAACSSINLPWAKSTTSQTQNDPTVNFASQPVENKLALGILKLEGTDKAVTAKQAGDMLPLWKAVKTLNRGSTTTTDEMTGLYQQIQELMTSDQIQAVKDMTLTQEDIRTLMGKYGVRGPQGGGGSSGMTPEQQATRAAARAQNSGGGGGGMPGGGPPPDVMMGPGGFGGQNGSNRTQQTPQANVAGQANQGGFRGGINFMFVDPVIKLLEERAKSS